MSDLRIGEAAQLLGVSEDTVRRLIESGGLPTSPMAEEGGRGAIRIPGTAVLAELQQRARTLADPTGTVSSARNRLVGLISEIEIDGVMAHVGMQCGPFTISSLLSAQSARELDLKPGDLAIASIKSTNVVIETPPQ